MNKCKFLKDDLGIGIFTEGETYYYYHQVKSPGTCAGFITILNLDNQVISQLVSVENFDKYFIDISDLRNNKIDEILDGKV